jgi:hypothetical protein
MEKNYAADISRLAAAAENIGNQLQSGNVAIREIEIKTADISVGDEVPVEMQGAPEAAPVQKISNADESLPKTDIKTTIPRKRATKKTPEPAPARTLTDAEIIERVRPFVDSSYLRPIFISKPVMGRVFIAMYPSYGELVGAEKLLGTPSGDENSVQEYMVLAEFSAAFKGWLPEHDQGVMTILSYPGDLEKWPKLNKVEFLNNIWPAMRSVIIPELVQQYYTWKHDVTPTDDEMSKFFGLVK